MALWEVDPNTVTDKELRAARENWEMLIARCFTKQEYEARLADWDRMTDKEYVQWAYGYLGNPENEKELYLAIDERQNEIGICDEESYAGKEMPYVIEHDENAKAFINNQLSKTKPNDVVRLTYNAAKLLVELWNSSDANKNIIAPSDLFFEKTIPLKDCIIEFQGDKYRICVFENYEKKIDETQSYEAIDAVAAIILYCPERTSKNVKITDSQIIMRLDLVYGMNGISCGPIYVKGDVVSKFGKNPIKTQFKYFEIMDAFVPVLQIWYGVQIALLHPQVKDVFSQPRVIGEVEPRHSNGRKNGKRKVKYVKIHTIDEDDLRRHMYGDGKTIERHTLVWYVVGHWRKLKNGGKTFVHPYWKGPLRDTKRPDEEREREIVIPTNLNSED